MKKYLIFSLCISYPVFGQGFGQQPQTYFSKGPPQQNYSDTIEYKQNEFINFQYQFLKHEQSIEIMKIKTEYLSKVVTLPENSSDSVKEALLKNYQTKVGELLIKFNKENIKYAMPGQQPFIPQPAFGEPMYRVSPSLGIPSQGNFICEPSHDLSTCTTPDGTLYKADGSVNKLDRHITKEVPANENNLYLSKKVKAK